MRERAIHRIRLVQQHREITRDTGSEYFGVVNFIEAISLVWVVSTSRLKIEPGEIIYEEI